MASILHLLFLFLWSFEASSITVGSPSILRPLSGPDVAVDLNSTNFDAVLSESPASFAVVQFFAHWCPACRNYKPHYERVARIFNGPDAVHSGIVLMTRVDCALKINAKLCDRFSIVHYPMLFWASPSKFASGGWEPKQDKKEIHAMDDARTADRLLNWINKQLGSEYSLDDEKYENEHLAVNASDLAQIVPSQVRQGVIVINNVVYES